MNRRTIFGAFGALSLALTLTAPAFAQQRRYSSTFSVSGAVANPASYTLADLQALPSQEVTVSFLSDTQSQQHVYKSVPLYTILQAARPNVDPYRNNDALDLLVRVSATDDYQIVIGWGEFDPGFGNKAILVAYEDNGQLLGDADGMARLVVPGDIRGGRYVGNMNTITVFGGRALGPSPIPTGDLASILRGLLSK
jgi:hypothetical protein